MHVDASARAPWWSWAVPVAAWLILIGAGAVPTLVQAAAPVLGAALVATVFAAVYHAEVVAHRVGEPFGTLVLALAVTVIEVALIVSMMLDGKAGAAELARDTVFAAVMIVCNGIVGLCLLSGGVRHHEQGFQVQGALAAMAVLAALTTLTLIVPNVTVSAPGPQFSTAQVIFAGIVSLTLYVAFVFVQTVRHRDDFLPAGNGEHSAGPKPTVARSSASFGLLLVSLVAVVLLAKTLSPTIEASVDALGAPKAVVGILIAALVLLPEGMAALKAARANQLQTSLNLALGSALASIGLTIPAVAVVSLSLDRPLVLGLDAKGTTLLALTLLVGVITLGTGRTTLLQGIVHLVVFAAFLFLAVVP